MKELSLNILDIAQNSVKAGASVIKIDLDESDETLGIAITDNGCGMTEEQVASVMDPFFTTRTTRNVGLGVPLLKMEAEQTGGGISVESSVSEENHGTVIKALFYKNHIDFIPLGDIVSTVSALIQGAPGIDWVFTHKKGEGSVELDTAEIRAVLGDDVRLDEYEVIKGIEDYLKEGYDSLT
jgi:signal transduction histidine kinase